MRLLERKHFGLSKIALALQPILAKCFHSNSLLLTLSLSVLPQYAYAQNTSQTASVTVVEDEKPLSCSTAKIRKPSLAEIGDDFNFECFLSDRADDVAYVATSPNISQAIDQKVTVNKEMADDVAVDTLPEQSVDTDVNEVLFAEQISELHKQDEPLLATDIAQPRQSLLSRVLKRNNEPAIVTSQKINVKFEQFPEQNSDLEKNIKAKLSNFTVESFKNVDERSTTREITDKDTPDDISSGSPTVQVNALVTQAAQAVGYYDINFEYNKTTEESDTLEIRIVPESKNDGTAKKALEDYLVKVQTNRIEIHLPDKFRPGFKPSQDNKIDDIATLQANRRVGLAFRSIENYPDLPEGDTFNHGTYEAFKNRITKTASDRGFFDAYWQMHDAKVRLPEHKADIHLKYKTQERYKLENVEFVMVDPTKKMPLRLSVLNSLVPFNQANGNNGNLSYEDYETWKISKLTSNLSDSRYFNYTLVNVAKPDSQLAQLEQPLDVFDIFYESVDLININEWKDFIDSTTEQYKKGEADQSVINRLYTNKTDLDAVSYYLENIRKFNTKIVELEDSKKNAYALLVLKTQQLDLQQLESDLKILEINTCSSSNIRDMAHSACESQQQKLQLLQNRIIKLQQSLSLREGERIQNNDISLDIKDLSNQIQYLNSKVQTGIAEIYLSKRFDLVNQMRLESTIQSLKTDKFVEQDAILQAQNKTLSELINREKILSARLNGLDLQNSSKDLQDQINFAMGLDKAIQEETDSYENLKDNLRKRSATSSDRACIDKNVSKSFRECYLTLSFAQDLNSLILIKAKIDLMTQIKTHIDWLSRQKAEYDQLEEIWFEAITLNEKKIQYALYRNEIDKLTALSAEQKLQIASDRIAKLLENDIEPQDLDKKTGEIAYDKVMARLNTKIEKNRQFAENVYLKTKAYESKKIPIKVYLNADRLNNLEAGVGYGTDTGIRLRGQYRRSIVNDRGHSFDANLELSQIRQAFSGRYMIPVTDKNPIQDYFSLVGGYEREIRDDIGRGLELNSESAVFGAEKVSKPQPPTYDGWSKTYSLRYRLDRIDTKGDVNKDDLPYAFRIITDSPEQQSLLVGAEFSKTTQRDERKRDADQSTSIGSMNPTHGFKQFYRAEVGSKNLLTETDLAILSSGWRFIQSVGDKYDHQFIGRADLGYIFTDNFSRVPYNLRYFAGGDQSIRGYDYKSLSPESGDLLIGGQALAIGSMEYNYQFKEGWRAAIFADVGNAYDKDFSNETKYGAGLGIRWASPVGPIRVDVAAGLSEDQIPIRLHFFIGPAL